MRLLQEKCVDEGDKMKKANVNPLQEVYLDMKDSLVPESDIINSDNYDMGMAFKNYIDWKLNKKELINIQVRGQVRKGKSTIGVGLMQLINEKLNNQPPYFSLIMSDQSEFLRFVKEGRENVCVLIDEYNKMSESGANATTERNLFEDYSARFAAKYNHRIACSPAGFVDVSSEIYLDVLTKEDGWTRVKVIYKEPTDRFGQNMRLIGWMDIDVTKTLSSDDFRNYYEKKMRRLHLLEKYGITDERPIEMAKFVKRVYNELNTVADYERISNSMIGATLESIKLELKERQMYSLIYDTEVIKSVSAMLDYKHFIGKLYKKRAKMLSGKSYNINAVKEIDTIIADFKVKLGNMLNTQTKYEQIWEEYKNIK